MIALNPEKHLERIAARLSQQTPPLQVHVTVDLGSAGQWGIDSRSSPARVRRDAAGSDLLLSFSPETFEALMAGRLKDTELGLLQTQTGQEPSPIAVQVWQAVFDAVGSTGNIHAQGYELTAKLMVHPSFAFMNHGYASLDAGEDFGWLKAEDADWRYSINLVRRLIQGVEIAGKRVLDVGCGRGGTCSYLSRYEKPAEVWGLDYSGLAIERCRDAHRIEGLRFVQGDAQALPFPARSVDVLTNIESSIDYPNPMRFYQEAHRVLSPGGVFCYTDMSPLGMKVVRSRVEAAGFEWLFEEEITPNVLEGLKRGRPDHERVARRALLGPEDEQRLRTLVADELETATGRYREELLFVQGLPSVGEFALANYLRGSVDDPLRHYTEGGAQYFIMRFRKR